MEYFDFTAPAELYASKGTRPGRHPVKYRRFVSGADAIRYAMEEMADGMLAGTVIECEERRLTSAEIQELYRSPDYPLPRNRA